MRGTETEKIQERLVPVILPRLSAALMTVLLSGHYAGIAGIESDSLL